MVLPMYWDGYFVQTYFSDRTRHNTGVTKMPMVSRVVPREDITTDNLKDLLDPAGFPIHVKNFVTVDQEKFINILNRDNKGKTMRMLDYSNWTTPHISPSCATFKIGKEVAFDEYSEKHLKKTSSKNHSPLYAGFESITEPDTLNELFGFDIKELGDYRQNNLFTSNFAHEILTASMHCAPIDSLTFQLLGTKTWFFVSPEDLAKLQAIPMPTFFNLPKTDDELLSIINNIHIVKQGPGDAMSFGPNWCHAVSTSPGPNLMFNMRYNAVPKLMKGPLSLFIKVIFRIYTRAIGNLPQDNTNRFPVIYSELNNFYNDCGASEAFNKIWEQSKGFTASF